jgi:hypothetical protein
MPSTPEHSQHDYVDLDSENRPARVRTFKVQKDYCSKGLREGEKNESSQVRIEDLPIANLWNLSQEPLRYGLVPLQATSNCELTLERE